MAKKKKAKISPSVIKISVVSLLALTVGFILYRGIHTFAFQSDYFRIKYVDIDPNLSILQKEDTERLLGKSIFQIDLKSIQKTFNYKYPQIKNLRVVKQYPDRIRIEAIKRLPFAQTVIGKKIYTFDDNGVVLSTSSKHMDDLPMIQNIDVHNDVRLGTQLESSSFVTAMKIIAVFKKEENLRSHNIKEIDVKNLSKILCMLSDKVQIYLDSEKIEYKIKLLGLIITQGQVDLEKIKYIDLRFNQPTYSEK